MSVLASHHDGSVEYNTHQAGRVGGAAQADSWRRIVMHRLTHAVLCCLS